MARSEYGGSDETPAGVQPKGQDALSASEKLGLIYRTGTTDPKAPLNPRAWRGETQERVDR